MPITNLEDALRAAKPISDGERYALVRVPFAPGAVTAAAGSVASIGEAFTALIVDKDEITLVIHADAWQAAQKRLPGAALDDGWRLITFDAPLDFSLVGFMAAISAALAEAGVSIMALSAFSRDHLLVKESQFEKAWETLSKLTFST